MKKSKFKSSSLPAGRKRSARRTTESAFDIDAKLAAIQLLIPIALDHVKEVLQDEVTALAGKRYARHRTNRDYKRWGKQRGSVFLGDQKVSLMVPRVRDLKRNQEVTLSNYHTLQQSGPIEDQLFVRILHGLSCRNYERAARLIPEAFSLSHSSVSRRFVRASAKKLDQLLQRRLDGHEFVALILDGKSFGDQQMVIALGITKTGEKVVLGFVECATENARVIKEFLRSLIERGLQYQQGLLVVIDGSKGLRKAIDDVFGKYAAVQRCQWHKRENIASYLSKTQQEVMRRKLQQAYEQPTYEQAKHELRQIRKELQRLNESAIASLDEGFEETLTLHRLGLFRELGISLKTTNSLESINSQIQRITRKVTSWKNSNQRQRWLASALLEIEPRLRKIKGYRYLPRLQEALQIELQIKPIAIAA